MTARQVGQVGVGRQGVCRGGASGGSVRYAGPTWQTATRRVSRAGGPRACRRRAGTVDIRRWRPEEGRHGVGRRGVHRSWLHDGAPTPHLH